MSIRDVVTCSWCFPPEPLFLVAAVGRAKCLRSSELSSVFFIFLRGSFAILLSLCYFYCKAQIIKSPLPGLRLLLLISYDSVVFCWLSFANVALRSVFHPCGRIQSCDSVVSLYFPVYRLRLLSPPALFVPPFRLICVTEYLRPSDLDTQVLAYLVRPGQTPIHTHLSGQPSCWALKKESTTGCSHLFSPLICFRRTPCHRVGTATVLSHLPAPATFAHQRPQPGSTVGC